MIAKWCQRVGDRPNKYVNTHNIFLIKNKTKQYQANREAPLAGPTERTAEANPCAMQFTTSSFIVSTHTYISYF